MKLNTQTLTLTQLLLLTTSLATAQGTTLTVDVTATSDQAVSAPAAERFLDRAAARLRTARTNLTVERVEGPITLGELDMHVFVASVMDSDGNKTVVALDAAGNAIDLDAARAEDNALATARRGKLSRRLAERIAADGVSEPQLVALWVTAPSVEDLREGHAHLISELQRSGPLDADMVDSMRLDYFASIAARVAPATRVAAERLRNAGFEVLGHDEYVPLVFVRGAAAELDRMAQDTGVESVDWAGMEYAERLNIANAEVRANLAWTASGSTTGVGARVAIVEAGAVCTTNPNLTVAATRIPAPFPSAHTTGVASCVASRDARGFGVAPGASILSANGADFFTGSTNVATQMPGSVAAITWAIGRGADILNLSYGAASPTATLSAFDRYLDYVARYLATTVVVACGNSGQFAGDPGAGFNQISVGAFNDAGNAAWAGESMAWFSSHRNPSTGVEAPQVAAPGVGINMQSCDANGFTYVSDGTSFSSPLVAGEAALIVSRDAALKSWPEAVRAIVMATAWHNIEGSAALSGMDGAGGIDARASVLVTGRGRGTGFQYGTLTASSFDAAGNARAQTAYVPAGRQVRACLSFDSVVTGATYASDALVSDLDLYVYGPNGQLVAWSVSGVNPFEVVQFTAATSGIYTVMVRRFRLGSTSEFYGTALSVSTDI